MKDLLLFSLGLGFLATPLLIDNMIRRYDRKKRNEALKND